MTRSKRQQGRGYRKACLEPPIRLAIADGPTLVPTAPAPAAGPSLLATLDLAIEALARARGQAARLPEVQAIDVAPALATDQGFDAATERPRRDPKVGDRTGGVRLETSLPGAEEGRSVFVYSAGCTGLQVLALDGADGSSGHRSPTPTPIYKLGTSTGSPRTRLLELSADGYAARSEPYGDDEGGFDDWTLARIVARPSADRAILVRGGVIEVRLPATLSPAGFEARLREALVPFLIEHHAAGGKRGDRVPRRWTRPRHLGGPSSRVTELYTFRPREDGDRLVALVEGILEEARSPTPAAGSHRTDDGTRPSPENGDLLALIEQILLGIIDRSLQTPREQPIHGAWES